MCVRARFSIIVCVCMHVRAHAFMTGRELKQATDIKHWQAPAFASGVRTKKKNELSKQI